MAQPPRPADSPGSPPPIALLHGYELEGSGSNLWTRAVARALARNGHTVHLMCQEPEPERYDFVAASYLHEPDGTVHERFRRDAGLPGEVIVHRPRLGEVIPVYVVDNLAVTPRRIRAVALSDEVLEDYLERNVRVLAALVRRHGLASVHANHTLFMSEVARRVERATGVPYSVIPHGSAIEYVVKRQERFRTMAAGAIASSTVTFYLAEEIRQRLRDVFSDVDGLESRLRPLGVGADTTLFTPLAHDERGLVVERLAPSLAERPGGKTAEQASELRRRALAAEDDAALAAVLVDGSDYDRRAPDADLEGRLAAVDWERDEIVFFAGRLVWGKGMQQLVAALPLLIERRPRLRLILAGDGPLRELLEVWVAALAAGRGELVDRLATWDRPLGGTEPPDFSEIVAFHDRLRAEGRWDDYLAAGRRLLTVDRVLFTGYLEHPLLRHLLPAADVCVLPSTVREAAPLVFVEAMASGVLPVVSDFGGLAASVDAVADDLPAAVVAAMRLAPEPERRVSDLIDRLPRALDLAADQAATLRRVAVERYDWTAVAATLAAALPAAAPSSPA